MVGHDAVIGEDAIRGRGQIGMLVETRIEEGDGDAAPGEVERDVPPMVAPDAGSQELPPSIAASIPGHR